MNRTTFAICLFLAMAPHRAAAETFTDCTKAEAGQAVAAIDRAQHLLLSSTAAIGPNPTFERWFGPYHPKAGEQVRVNLKAMVRAMRSDKVSVICRNNGQGLCASDTYAFVESDIAYRINLCPNFFAMDTMKELTRDSVIFGNGTRSGTIIHEFSHFPDASGTEDICYSREECAAMAVARPDDALINADSYQYFVEDVTFFGVHRTEGSQP